ncbi:MAG TPA: fasciclin domain-containing protein [Chitinophagaceae bacterium]|nr:fasciclin domain-containing protein [Chitinophagaceae bacterium]
MTNITQVVNADKNLTTLKKSVIASGLDKVLSGQGPFTVFAPSDLAFEKLGKGVLDDLLKIENKAKLVDVLNYHVVPGKLNYKDFKDGEKLKTVNGKELLVHVKNGSISIQGAKIQDHDLQTSNGVIHSLDAVMFKN